MVLDKKKAYQNLKKKGFVDSDNHSGDHKYLEFYHNDKLICYTKISNGSKKDLDAFLIKQMSNQCKITKLEFADLVNCPLSAAEYLNILKEKGELD
jgi:hypothetical protein